MVKIFHLIYGDILFLMNDRWRVLMPFFSFMLSVSLLPFLLEPQYLFSRVMIAMIWVSFLPALIFGAEQLIAIDIQDGFIDRYFLMNVPHYMIVLSKMVSLFVFALMPILVFLPLVSLFFHLDFWAIASLFSGILVGAPCLIGFCVFGALISLNTRSGVFLSFITIFPLLVPAIIFGASVQIAPNTDHQALILLLIFSLISILVTVPASSFLYRQLHIYR